MTELTLQEAWQSAPIETELARLRRERAEKFWHPTTPARVALMVTLQAIKNEDEK